MSLDSWLRHAGTRPTDSRAPAPVEHARAPYAIQQSVALHAADQTHKLATLRHRLERALQANNGYTALHYAVTAALKETR